MFADEIIIPIRGVVVNNLWNLTNIRYDTNVLLTGLLMISYTAATVKTMQGRIVLVHIEKNRKEFQTAHSLVLACPLEIWNDESSRLWKGGREPIPKSAK